MIWRIFFQWERISRFSTLCVVKSFVYSQVKCKNFRENNFCSKRFTMKLISRNNFQVIQKFRKLHTVLHSVEKREILSHWKKIRQINYLVISLVKPLLSRNFCERIVRENLRNFNTVSSSSVNFHCAHAEVIIWWDFWQTYVKLTW